jgi:hypothetical protein
MLLSCLLATPALASHDSTHPLSDDEWKTVEQNIGLIDTMNFMPTLLPLIMRNRDALQLTPGQIKQFRDWRKKNYVAMVNVMNEILEARVAFKQKAMDVSTTEEQLQLLQDEIFALQRKLLLAKLSCRQMLVDTFTEEQWENFAFVASEDPNLAAFVK